MAGFVPFWLTGFDDDDDYLSNGMAYATVLNIPWLKKNPLCSSALIALPVFFLFFIHTFLLLVLPSLVLLCYMVHYTIYFVVVFALMPWST